MDEVLEFIVPDSALLGLESMPRRFLPSTGKTHSSEIQLQQPRQGMASHGSGRIACQTDHHFPATGEAGAVLYWMRV